MAFAARYYIEDSEDQLEFGDVESVVLFWSENRNDEGELFIRDISAIKIKYNINTGSVSVVSSEKKKDSGVKNFYSKEAFNYLLTPISQAIRLLAKIDFLFQLKNLKDNEISSIISLNHVDKDGKVININETSINKTFKQLLKCTRPGLLSKQTSKLHQAVYQVLSKINTEIKSKNDGQKIIDMIKESI